MREHIWKTAVGTEMRAVDLPASALTGSPISVRVPCISACPESGWHRSDNARAVALEILRLAEENRVLKATDKAVEKHLPVWEAEQLEAVRVAQENEREARTENHRRAEASRWQIAKALGLSELSMEAILSAIDRLQGRAIEKRDRWRQECEEKHVDHLKARVLELTQERDALERSLKLADATAVERIAYLFGNALATDREHSRLSAEIAMLRELNATQAEEIRAMVSDEATNKYVVESLRNIRLALQTAKLWRRREGGQGGTGDCAVEAISRIAGLEVTVVTQAAKIREMGQRVVSFLADYCEGYDIPEYAEIPVRAIVESEEPLCLCGHAQGCHATTFSECWNCGCEGFQPDLGGADCSGGTGEVPFAPGAWRANGVDPVHQ